MTSRSSATTTRRASRPRCRAFWIAIYLPLQLLCVSVTFFVRNCIDIGKAEYEVIAESSLMLEGGKRAEILFSPDWAKVLDCYRFDREERLQICTYIRDIWAEDGIRERSVQSLESELALHAFSYRLGVATEHTEDADLDVRGDPRWYVSAGYSIIEFLGL